MDSVPTRMPRRRLLAWLSALPCLAAHAAGPVLVLAGTEDIRPTLYGEWLDRIYREALRRLGYRLDYRVYPPKRANALAMSGQVDGEINRHAHYADTHPELVRVDEPHFTMRFAAYGMGRKAPLHGWGSLRHSGYRVEYCSGVAAAQQALEEVVPAGHLSTAANITQGLHKLLSGRTDIFIDIEALIDTQLATPEFRGSRIEKLGILEERPFHAYLRRERAELAPQLAQILRGMKREGVIDALRKEAEQAARPQ